VTIPAPVPASITLKVSAPWLRLNVALTVSLALRLTVQVGLLPVQPPPDQPAKVAFVPGVSLSVTRVPGSKLALQIAPQLIPEGLLETVPTPVPARLTLNTGAELKVAVTCSLLLSATVQMGLAPLHAPVHPPKYELAAVAAVRVT